MTEWHFGSLQSSLSRVCPFWRTQAGLKVEGEKRGRKERAKSDLLCSSRWSLPMVYSDGLGATLCREEEQSRESQSPLWPFIEWTNNFRSTENRVISHSAWKNISSVLRDQSHFQLFFTHVEKKHTHLQLDQPIVNLVRGYSLPLSLSLCPFASLLIAQIYLHSFYHLATHFNLLVLNLCWTLSPFSRLVFTTQLPL